MRKRTRISIGIAAATLIFSTSAWATNSSGTTSTLLAPPTVYGAFSVTRDSADGWSVKIDANNGLKIAVQAITFQPGGQSGWHSHPGPVFISVKEGTMTFYEDDCTFRVVNAGEGFLDVGSHPHLARNESSAPATTVVTYFVPPSAPSLRIDQPRPANCWVVLGGELRDRDRRP